MNLHQLLEAHTWRMLRAISQTHGAPFDTHWSKAQAAAVYRLLSASHAADAASSLPPDARAALRSLLLCGGRSQPSPSSITSAPSAPSAPGARTALRHLGATLSLPLSGSGSSDEGDLVTIPDDLPPLAGLHRLTRRAPTVVITGTGPRPAARSHEDIDQPTQPTLGCRLTPS